MLQFDKLDNCNMSFNGSVNSHEAINFFNFYMK